MNSYEKIILLDKGFSNDEKWLIQSNGEFFVLRLFEGNEQRRGEEFAILQQLEALDVRSLRAISIKEGEMITSYLEGEDGEEAIHSLTDE